MRWHDVISDPNAPAAREYRGAQLQRALTTIDKTRDAFYAEHASGKRVLDIGCVDHDFDLRHPHWWLHGILARHAAELVGVDIDATGVAKMNAAGYQAVAADICEPDSAAAHLGQFDLVVAGEVIEHVPNPQGFLAAAATFLAARGQLIVTTPNPYAPWRVRAGQRGHTWENVDHVIYAFPSGMAEMADRCGLRLSTYGTIDITRRRPTWSASLAEIWRTWRRATELVGRNPTDNNRFGLPLDPVWPSPLDVLVMKVRRGPMLGEDAVYIFERA